MEPETKLTTEDKCEETQVIFLWNRIDVIHMTSLYILSFSKISSTKSVALKIFQLTGVAADDRDPECCADHCHLDDQLLESAGMWILFENGLNQQQSLNLQKHSTSSIITSK